MERQIVIKRRAFVIATYDDKARRNLTASVQIGINIRTTNRLVINAALSHNDHLFTLEGFDLGSYLHISSQHFGLRAPVRR